MNKINKFKCTEKHATRLGDYLESKGWNVFNETKCSNCKGAIYTQSYKYCPHCGLKLKLFFDKESVIKDLIQAVDHMMELDY